MERGKAGERRKAGSVERKNRMTMSNSRIFAETEGESEKLEIYYSISKCLNVEILKIIRKYFYVCYQSFFFRFFRRGNSNLVNRSGRGNVSRQRGRNFYIYSHKHF